MPYKDPQELLDYGFDYGTWLAAVDDTIATSTWTITTIDGDAAPLIKDPSKGDTHDDTTTTIWLKGGALQKRYKVTNHIVTADGRETDRTMSIIMDEK